MNTMTNSNDLSNGSSQWLSDHLKSIEMNIRKRAKELGEQQNRNTEPRDIATAAIEYAPGDKFPKATTQLDLSFWRRMGLSITGVTLVSGTLAIVFGVIGYLGARGNTQFAALTTGAFDIAKIFAGAVVGSTVQRQSQ